MTILDDIILEKKKEVAQLKTETYNQIAPTYNGKKFAEVIRERRQMGIIAEIKRASPSKGLINGEVQPAKQAKTYETNGASAISVLTDTPFFQGTMADLQEVREAVGLPILCKDFIIDEIQIDRAKAYGANIILLIAAALDAPRLRELYDYAVNLDLEVLCEVHNEAEMEIVLQLEPELVGVNNRNLKTFEVDLTITQRIANMVKQEDIILISESGIRHQQDVEEVANAGAKVILVGETLMRSTSLVETMQELQIPLPTKVEKK